MQNGAKTASGASAGTKKESLRARALDELKKYAVITLYLWVLFVLFATYKRMLLQEERNQPWNQGFAIVNALIFGQGGADRTGAQPWSKPEGSGPDLGSPRKVAPFHRRPDPVPYRRGSDPGLVPPSNTIDPAPGS